MSFYRKHKKLNFKLASEISRKMILMYLGIYIFILVLLCALLIPHLYKYTHKSTQHTLEVAVDEFIAAQKNVSGSINFLYTDLTELLKEYQTTPDKSVEARIELALTNYVSNQDTLLAACLEDFDSHFFQSNFFHNVVTQDLLHENPKYQRLFSKESTSFYSFYTNDVFQVEDRSYSSYHYVLSYSQIQTYNQQPYILTTYYDMNSVMRHCTSLFEDFFTDFAIYSPQDGLLYASDSGKFCFQDAELDTLFDYRKSADSCFIQNGYLYFDKDFYANWVYLAYTPFYLFFRDSLIIIGIITALYLFSPLLYTFLLYPSVNKALSPLDQLHKAMKHYSPTAPPAALEIHTGNEIEELCGIYNSMTQKISQQIQDIHEKEHINAVTNYKLLATQIDPHFIYNTMNIINIMARQGKQDEIVEVNSALIKILRERLNTKLSIVDTLEKELFSLYQYQVIMNYRYENQVLIHVDADEALMQKKIPKNILQPLAENSFYHGFANLQEGQQGLIDILIYSQDENMVIELSDNGAGIEKERLKMLQDHSYRIYEDSKPHIGLDNIRQRLYYVYGDRFQLDIISAPGCGTTISITIPTDYSV